MMAAGKNPNARTSSLCLHAGTVQSAEDVSECPARMTDVNR